MVVVDDLDERLDLGALGHLLLTHGTGHLQRRAFDTGNDSVTVGSVLGTFIVVYNEAIKDRECFYLDDGGYAFVLDFGV
jgi:hypothetical protein